jgi:hypothetical protein
MTSIDVLTTEPGRLATEVAWLDFYAVPIRQEYDFACVPRNAVSFADARKVSVDLAHRVVAGRIGRFKWRKSTETADLCARRKLT